MDDEIKSSTARSAFQPSQWVVGFWLAGLELLGNGSPCDPQTDSRQLSSNPSDAIICTSDIFLTHPSSVVIDSGAHS